MYNGSVPRTVLPSFKVTIPAGGTVPDEEATWTVKVTSRRCHEVGADVTTVVTVGAKAGDLVEVLDEQAQRVGYGLFNPKSELSLRMLSRGDALPDEAWWRQRLVEAVTLRRRCAARTA